MARSIARFLGAPSVATVAMARHHVDDGEKEASG